MAPTRGFRDAARTALATLLSLALAVGPVSAQDNSDRDRNNGSGGLFDSLNSGDSSKSNDEEGNDSNSLDSNSNDNDNDSDSGEVVLLAGLVVLVVAVSVAATADSNRRRNRAASREAADAMARLRKAEDVLAESAVQQSPLTVVDKRPADSREHTLTPEQRRRAMVVTASTPAGEQLAFTVGKDAAERAADGPLFVQALEAGWQVTGGDGVLSFVPSSQLVELAGHRRLGKLAAARGVQGNPTTP